MIIGGRRSLTLLFAGDLIAFAFSLYLALILRHGTLPSASELGSYVVPFSLLFALWVLVFYSAGLYSKRAMLFPSKLPDALLRTQVANTLLAALFFFLVPSFGIAPKTILVLYLIVSFGVILFWRLVLYPRVSHVRTREQAVLLARGADADELYNEVNGNVRYGIEFRGRELGSAPATLVVVDEENADDVARDRLVNERVQVISFEDLYEEVFDRMPLSRLGHAWFRDHVTLSGHLWYRSAKRAMDILGGLLMGLVTLVALPFVYLALRIEGPGPLFIVQERMGERGARIRALKFRSMSQVDKGAWAGETENKVTRVGNVLRKTSLDEFPQFLNILKGELSLIGPRNDIVALGERLAESIPYYLFRYSVRPGITGWAQINQQYEQGNISPQSIEETKLRLAYDFYYLKHRSFGLDVLIALRTIKKMFFRVSSW